MEGLIPFIYKVVIQYRAAGGQEPTMADSWFRESPPPASYVRLPGDSGHFTPPHPCSTISPPTGFSTGNPSPLHHVYSQ
ncbi:hypothetical protein EZV62_002749 [Acer yangbiense]|uniref:Uncharacterized protein n=1 Tax=Acer yangbiense TaxID=1000413 RepID=A0A5C7IY59_9ROSI|nr:hypothetical protein EZV62_002749 [Acer yangbiense]